MPLQATSGAASYDAFGGGVPSEPNYIESVFSCFLWTTSGSDQTLTTGIDMTKGALTWIKSRSNAYPHILQTGIGGGVLPNNALSSNSTAAYAGGNYRIADSTTGFTMGVDYYTGTPQTAVVWTFRKQPKFFDVVTYTGTGSPVTVNHNLGSTPGCIIIKATSNAQNWQVWHRSAVDIYGNGYLILNSTAAVAGGPLIDSVSSTNFVVSSGASDVGYTYVCYVFAHDAGGFGLTGTDNVISCGSFTGSASGTTVNLGWEPQWVLIKRSSGNTDNWRIYDNMRGMTASNGGQLLYADTSGSETTNSRISVNATGFGFVDDAAYGNIYIAIRRGPMKVPTSGTSVYSVFADGASTNPKTFSAGFPTDFAISQVRSTGAGSYNYAGSRLTGNSQYLVPQTTGSEQADTTPIWTFDLQNSFKQNISAASMVSWLFRRAPSFFDEVCYTGTGSARTVTHNLGVVPELMIVKGRAGTRGWRVYYGVNTKAAELNSTGSADTNSVFWNNTSPTASVFTVGTDSDVNSSAVNYVAYLFATCAGVSKVTTFTGNGSSQTINCGFTGGARFVLIKRVDSTGNWVTFDTARGIVSGNDPALYLNSTAAEVTGVDAIDPDSTGFIVNQESTFNLNVSSATYLVLAIA